MRLLRHLFARSARSVYPEASLQRIAEGEGQTLKRAQTAAARRLLVVLGGD